MIDIEDSSIFVKPPKSDEKGGEGFLNQGNREMISQNNHHDDHDDDEYCTEYILIHPNNGPRGLF